MEWISYKENKPTEMITALVCNSKGWMYQAMALYHPREETWVLYDVNYRHSITVEVTHYIQIPPGPERG